MFFLLNSEFAIGYLPLRHFLFPDKEVFYSKKSHELRNEEASKKLKIIFVVCLLDGGNHGHMVKTLLYIPAICF